MNNWIEIVKDRNFHFHRISSLVILMVLVMGAMIGLVLPYFASNFPITFSPLIQVILLLVAELALIIYWYYYNSIHKNTYLLGLQSIKTPILLDLNE